MLPLWHIAVLTWLLAAWLVAPLATPRAAGASLARVQADTQATVEPGGRDRIVADDADDEDATCGPQRSAPAPIGVGSASVPRPARCGDRTNPWPAAMPRGPPVPVA